MTPTSRSRGWIPGAVAAAVMVIGIWALQALTEIPAIAERVERARTNGSGNVVESFVFDELTYYGRSGLDLFSGPTSYGVAVVVGTLLVAGTCFAGTWWVTRGARPRAVGTVFFATWAVTTLAAAIGAYLGFVVAFEGDVFGTGFAGQHGWTFDAGARWGFSWGWVAAVAAALTWLVVSSREASTDPPPPSGLAPAAPPQLTPPPSVPRGWEPPSER